MEDSLRGLSFKSGLTSGMLGVACVLLIGTSPAIGAATPTIESLLIGPGDLLHVQVVDTPEMDQHPRVTDSGEIPVEGAGSIKVSGLTPAAAAAAIRAQLIAKHYMLHPEVLVSIDQYATQTVSVIGEVKVAGAYVIGTPRSILDVLALAGGLTGVADRRILITRHNDPTNRVRYTYSNNSEEAAANQVLVGPGDTVIVPKVGIVYVLGDVNRPGAYSMSNNESTITLLEALALAGGVSKTAKEGHTRLIHQVAGGSYTDRQLSVADLQDGKLPDIPLQSGDVIYVPFSYGKTLAVLGAGSIAASATSAAVYAIP